MKEKPGYWFDLWFNLFSVIMVFFCLEDLYFIWNDLRNPFHHTEFLYFCFFLKGFFDVFLLVSTFFYFLLSNAVSKMEEEEEEDDSSDW
jgi:hypothetical protein